MSTFTAPYAPAQVLPPPLRLLSGLLSDAVMMARAGYADAADIDAAMQLGAGYPSGPFALLNTLAADQQALFGKASELQSVMAQAAVASALADRQDGLAGVVGVVGSGTMASGIVEALLKAGRSTLVLCRSEASATRLQSRLADHFARLQERGKLTAAESAAALELLSVTTDSDDLARCRFIIEAVKESLAVKRELFASLHAQLPPAVAFATNTSSFRVSDMENAAPGRIVFAMHFFNPAGVMKLVELVFTKATPETFRQEAAGFVRAIGKVPVICADTRGFIVNRLLIPFLNDAVRAHEEGVPAAEIDRLMTEEMGHPMGPLALIDMIGLDVTVFALEAMAETEQEGRLEPAQRLRELVSAGCLGRKSGRGFHDYEGSR